MVFVVDVEILASRFVLGDGRIGEGYCEMWRDIFCNGEIFYFTIFLSPAFSGLLGDSGTKKERGGGEREGKGRRRAGLFLPRNVSRLYFRQMHLVQSHRCSTDYLRLSPPSAESPPVPPFLSRVINSIEHLE